LQWLSAGIGVYWLDATMMVGWMCGHVAARFSLFVFVLLALAALRVYHTQPSCIRTNGHCEN
jgi:hypothetical protein